MFRKELTYYFSTPIAYIVIGLYLISISLFLWVIPGEWNIVDSGYAQIDGLFQISPWLMMLLCPALTMRLFSEERASGVWELIRTKPYPLWRIVLDKYLASWILMLLALLPNIIHYIVVWYLADPIGNIDGGQVAGSITGLVLISGGMLGIGYMAATLSKSQITCYVIGVVGCFVLYWILLQNYYNSLARGVIDMRDILFFISFITVAIATTWMIAKRL